MGGDLGGRGTVQPKFEVGGRSMHPSIWRSSVKGCAGKYEVTKKGEDGEICCVK